MTIASINNIASMLKAQCWQRAKGELEALTNMQGCYPSTNEEQSEIYNKLSAKVRAFIDDIEDHGLEE